MNKELKEPKPLEQRLKDLHWLLDNQEDEITRLTKQRDDLAAAIEAMRVAEGAAEFQLRFDQAKALASVEEGK